MDRLPTIELGTGGDDIRAPRAIATVILAAIGGVLLLIPTVLLTLGVTMAGGLLATIALAVCVSVLVFLHRISAPRSIG